MVNAFGIKVAPERLQCPLVTLAMKMIKNDKCYSLFRREFDLSLCTVLIAHICGGVLVDAVVGEVSEHISNFGALVAVFVGREPGDWRLLDLLKVSIPTT